MTKVSLTSTILPFCFLLSSCDKKEDGNSLAPTSPKAESKIATKRGNQTVLATVGDGVITVDRFKEEFKLRGGGDTSDAGRERLMNELVGRLKLLQYARQKGYDQDLGYIRQIEDLLISKLKATELREQQQKHTDLSQDAVRDYYDTHIEQFTNPARARVSLIFVATNSKNLEEKRQFLEDLKAEILAAELQPDEKFGGFAVNFSDDAHTKVRGGDTGYLLEGMDSKSRHPVEVFEAAFKLEKKGDMSDIVETEKGFYLVKITDRAPSSVQAFESVKQAIIKRLASGSKEAIQDGIESTIDLAVPSEVNTELLNSITLDKSTSSPFPIQELQSLK